MENDVQKKLKTTSADIGNRVVVHPELNDSPEIVIWNDCIAIYPDGTRIYCHDTDTGLWMDKEDIPKFIEMLQSILTIMGTLPNVPE